MKIPTKLSEDLRIHHDFGVAELCVSITTASSFLNLSMTGPYTITASLLGQATRLAVSATGSTIWENVASSAPPATLIAQNLAR